MHLTNYSINKHNENFDRDDSDDSGSKRYNTTTLLYNKHKKKIISCILISAAIDHIVYAFLLLDLRLRLITHRVFSKLFLSLFIDTP